MVCFCFFNDTATTGIYTLSLHDALPILVRGRDRARVGVRVWVRVGVRVRVVRVGVRVRVRRSEEHTSELQSPDHLVCRLLLEKKKVQALYGFIRPQSLDGEKLNPILKVEDQARCRSADAVL